MNKLIAVSFLLFASQLHAQKNIDGLINTEKNFAAYSVEHGTKDAFLKFLDSNGVVFEQGKAVNGIQAWNKKEKRPGVLNWEPQYAEIASSNDFGYTTGPWEFKPGANTDSVVARGRYTTVWHIDNRGEWKFLVDLGSGNTPKVEELSAKKINAKKVTGTATTEDVLKAENDFIKFYNEDKRKAYQQYLSTQSILNRNGSNPATNPKDQAYVIGLTPSNMQFTIIDSGIASSGDLAYVYGTTVIDTKTENYLHIWRKENGGWKIALEVLRY